LGVSGLNQVRSGRFEDLEKALAVVKALLGEGDNSPGGFWRESGFEVDEDLSPVLNGEFENRLSVLGSETVSIGLVRTLTHGLDRPL
jgi:hypothetical protein